MGGSAVCGDLVRAIFTDRLRVPLVSVRDYDLPSGSGSRRWSSPSSHRARPRRRSARSRTALERRCPVAVITTGGPIGEVAKQVDLPRLLFPNESPPRAALGYTIMLADGHARARRLPRIDDPRSSRRSTRRARLATSCAADMPTETNLAKQLAWSLLDRLPVIEGSGCMAAVARRWKTQINENANSAAASEELPEATHNTVVGYEQPETMRDHQYVVFLASDADTRAIASGRGCRLSCSRRRASTFSASRSTVRAASRQACAAISLGDYVSCLPRSSVRRRSVKDRSADPRQIGHG